MKLRMLGLTAAILLVAITAFWSSCQPPSDYTPRALSKPLQMPAGAHQSYSTTFPVTEVPLYEKGNWLDGKVTGLDWTSVATVRGLAYGNESGTGKAEKAYDDSVAILAGHWGPDQTVEARVHSVNQTEQVLEEVELRLRSSISPHTSTGYEVLFRCLRTSKAYASIVRWDGAEGKFTYLSQEHGLRYGVGDGDLVSASIVGTEIRGYINGVQVLSANDSTFRSGSPGIGFWMAKHDGLRALFTMHRAGNTDYGFTSVAAWDTPVLP